MHSRIRSAASIGVLAALVCAVSAQQPARDAAPRIASGTGVISGTIVTDERTSRPVRRATVTLNMTNGAMLQVMQTAVTDDAGRFAFTRLPAGRYSPPRVTKAGFVAATYGEKRPGGIGTPITLTDGQRLTIAMKMLRGAVITGTVLDQNAKPMAQISVQASSIRIVNGQRTAGQDYYASTTTDDRGVYRIYGLLPGDYLISASPRSSGTELRPITEDELRWGQQQMQPGGAFGASGAANPNPAPKPAQPFTYATVHYPGTTDIASATLVTVAAGQERTGVDFGVQFVPTARIEGTIADPSGRPPQTVQVNLVPKIENAELMASSILLMDALLLASRPTVTNGKFSLAGVKPGQYTLTARAAPAGAGPTPAGAAGRGAAPPMTLWATTEISVNGQDLSGIALQLEQGMTLTGRVAFDGTTLQPPTDPSRVSIRLQAAPSPSGVTVTVNGSSAAMAADGTFKLEGLTPGRYLLFASAPAPNATPTSNWSMRSAMVGGVDAADVAFEVKPSQDISNAVITFTDRMAEVSGTMFDASGKPTPEYSVYLFPTDKAMWSQRSRRFRPAVRTATDGSFKFTNVIPGEYHLAALTDFNPSDLYDPAFLEQVIAAGTIKITVAEGEKKEQNMKLGGGWTNTR